MYWDHASADEQYGKPGWDLWAELLDCQDHWSDTYRSYWGLDADPLPDHLLIQKFLAEITLQMALALSVQGGAKSGKHPEFTQDELKTLRRALSKASSNGPQIRDQVSLTLAKEALDQLGKSTDRALRLVSLIQGKGLSERASQYVYRAARLYVWGFEPECAIMCRSALEAALATALEAHIDMDHAQPSLDELIKGAGQHKLLAGYEAARTEKGWRARRDTVLWAAQRIQRTADGAAHQFPVLGQDSDDFQDAFEVLQELTVVLNALFPLRRSE